MSEKNSSGFPLVFDGHNDTILNLHNPERGHGRSFFEWSEHGHIDLPRARDGGLGGGFFALFAPPKINAHEADTPTSLQAPVDHDHALQYVISMAARLIKLVAESKGQAALVTSAAQIQDCLQNGVLAMLMHIEGAEAIDPALDALYVLYEAGLRSIGPVWSRPNIFGTGVPFTFPSSPDIGPGLTAEGQALVRACNQLGLVVDLSHLNEKGFWDVARISDAPLVATHSNAYAVTPSPRNLTDKQLDAIAESGGIVGINFHVSFLRPDGQKDPKTPLEDIRRHATYIADRIGIDHVAFGSDFDGALIPAPLGDVAGLTKLMAEFRDNGFDEISLRKIAHENWLRVLRATLN